MSATLISVIMPTYNRADYLMPAIKSVLEQDTPCELELIIVDDCSTDATEDSIKGLEDARVKYLRNHKNIGAAASRNRGIELASGKYIAFIDSDTYWYKNKLSEQLALMEQCRGSNVGVIYSGFRKQQRSGWKSVPAEFHDGNLSNLLLSGNFIDTPSALVDADILRRVGCFDEKLPRFQDWDLFLRISEISEFLSVKVPLLDSLTLADAISANDKARNIALIRIYEKYSDRFALHKKSNRRMVAKIVNSYLLLGDSSSARDFLLPNMSKLGVVHGFLWKLICRLPKGSVKQLNQLKKRI